jgi:flagellar biosynthesis/type III secretory pathway chaperone
MLFTPRVGLHMTYQRVVRTMAKNQEPNEEMSELIEESTSASLLNQLGALNRDRANETPNIGMAVPSDVSTLLERMSGLSLAEMDKAIQELQRVRNFLRNERERLRLEIAEHLRLTQAAMGSAKAVSASVASFGTVAEDFGKSRAAV